MTQAPPPPPQVHPHPHQRFCTYTTGLRRKPRWFRRGKYPVTDQDHWHLGSCGKAMTATLMARLVEQSQSQQAKKDVTDRPQLLLTWNTTLADINLVPDDSPHASITMTYLLTHTSGIAANLNSYREYYRRVYQRDLHQGRQQLLKDILDLPLVFEPGTDYLYSNLGYSTAGIVMEKATGRSYEDLMQKEVFDPLEMKPTGWGPTTDSTTTGSLWGGAGVHQPWPHDAAGVPLWFNGWRSDNPQVLAPAGTAHTPATD